MADDRRSLKRNRSSVISHRSSPACSILLNLNFVWESVLLPYLIYLAIIVFVVGNLYRAVRIARMPVHLRWEIYPVPHEPPHKVRYGGSYMEDSDWWRKSLETHQLGELGVMLPEIFLLKGVWENNKQLWFWSLLMHWGLYLLIGTIGLIVISSIGELTGLMNTTNGTCPGLALFWGVKIIGWMAGITGVIGSLGVLILRLFSKKLRLFTSFMAVFNLVILLALFGTGVIAFAAYPDAISKIFSFFVSLTTFSAPESPGTILSIHAFIFAFFLLYFPFTHMTHMFLKYFTYHSVRWDDQPLGKGSSREHSVVESLNYPVSWSAPHIRGDGKKNWIDVVSEDGSKND